MGRNTGGIGSCLWDADTSGRMNMCGTEVFGGWGCDASNGKTTSQMQDPNTFTSAGWDFQGESTNGTDDIWTICEGTNYPRFVWRVPLGDLVCPDGVALTGFSFFEDSWMSDNCDAENGFCGGADMDQSGVVDLGDGVLLFESWLAGVGLELLNWRIVLPPKATVVKLGNSNGLATRETARAPWQANRTPGAPAGIAG